VQTISHFLLDRESKKISLDDEPVKYAVVLSTFKGSRPEKDAIKLQTTTSVL